jgi:Ca2+-binding EF-hand superfamily protein
MKSSVLLCTAAVLGLAVLVMPARAATDEGQGPALGGLPARLLEKFDANHDSKLDEQERAAAKAWVQEHRGELIQKFDTNGDGKLDDQERAAAKDALRTKLQGRREEIMKKFDKNGDGKIDDQERAEAKEAIKARIAENHPEAFKKFDTNGDGKIDDAEWAAAKEALKEKFQGGAGGNLRERIEQRRAQHGQE